MTTRCIPIDHCNGCPHRDHRGAFGKVKYKPWCQRTGRNLPHTVDDDGYAKQKSGIPGWCPLPALEPQIIAST